MIIPKKALLKTQKSLLLSSYFYNNIPEYFNNDQPLQYTGIWPLDQ